LVKDNQDRFIEGWISVRILLGLLVGLLILVGLTTAPAPVVSNLGLSSSSGMNTSIENLTISLTAIDADNESVKNITNWYRNGSNIMVLNMPFEGGSNSTFTKDYSGYGNNGTVSGATWNASSGYDGKGAYQFDGSSDFINVSDDNSLDIATELTISAWVKLDTLDNSAGTRQRQPIIAKYDASTSQRGLEAGFEDTLNSRCIDKFAFAISSTLSVFTGGIRCSDISPAVDTWYHVVYRFKANDHMEIYINGTNHSENSFTLGSLPSGIAVNSMNLLIGRAYDDIGFFNGSIDDLQIYNRSLSPEQIQALYQNRTDLVVSAETNVGDIWHACVTPNDGNSDGTKVCSNNLTVLPNHVQNTNTGQNFTTIQGAINDASTLAGHTLSISAGTYYEAVAVTKSLNLVGAGPSLTIINATGKGDHAIYVTAGSTNLSALMATYATTGGDAGIRLNAPNTRVENVIVSDSSDGIFVMDDYATIYNVTITGIGTGDSIEGSFVIGLNISESTIKNGLSAAGVLLYNVSDSTVYNNIIFNNTGANADGVEFSSPGAGASDNNIISSNNISNNAGSGVDIGGGSSRPASNNTIRDNIFSSNDRGVYIVTNVGSGNTILNNTFTSHTNEGVFIQAGVLTTVENNTFSGNADGIEIRDNNNSIINNTITSNGLYGIYLLSSATNNTIRKNKISGSGTQGIRTAVATDNNIYNNFLNNTINVQSTSGNNSWNTTETASTNILGWSKIGGNYYATPTGTGFSESCTNRGDGICSTNNTHATGNIDFLPLTLNPSYNITSCVVISNSGVYTVSNDILNSSSTACIEITSDDVTIDGQGYTIDGVDTASTYGVYGDLGGSNKILNLTIKNLTLSDWERGIYFWRGEGLITNNTIISNSRGVYFTAGVTGTPRVNITYNRFENNTDDSIAINWYNNNLIEGNTILNSGDDGMLLGSSDYNTIQHNTVRNSTGRGISLDDVNTVYNNTLINNEYGVSGNVAGGNNVTGNTIMGSSKDGIWFATTSSEHIENNIINNTGGNGINLFTNTGDSNIINNTIISTSGYGIYIDSGNNIDIINNTLTNSSEEFRVDINAINVTLIDNLFEDVLNSFTFSGAFIVSRNTSPASDPSGYQNINKYLTITNQSDNAYLYLNVSYNSTDIGSLNESTLKIWRHNGTWSQVGGTNGVDEINNYVYANITSFSIFAPIIVFDQAPPNITMTTPQNTSYNNSTISLNVSANETIDTWWYSLDGGASNNTFTPNTTITASEGANSLIVYANDTIGNENSSTIAFTVDTTSPTISIALPQNTTYGSSTISLNVTADEAIDTWWYTLDGGATNNTFTPNTTITGSEGANTLTVYANDTIGNENSSTIAFTVDTTSPTISISSPVNSSINTISTVNLNVTANEAISSWWYSIDGGANTSFTPNITLSSLSNALHTLIVYANDTIGNLNSTSVVFTVDTTAPIITVYSPQNQSYNTPVIDLNVSADKPINTWWYIIDSGSATIFTPNTTLNGLSESGHNITFYANISSGSQNSAFVYFTNDSTSPLNSITIPLNGSNINIFNDIIYGSVIDATPVENVSITLNSVPLGNFSINQTTNTYSPFLNYQPGALNNLTITTTDSAGNINTISIQVFVFSNIQTYIGTGIENITTTILDFLNGTDTIIEVTPKINLTYGINVTAFSNETNFGLPKFDNLSVISLRTNETAVGKFIEINTSDNINETSGNLSRVKIKMFYRLEDLDLDGDGLTNGTFDLNESSFRMYWYNPSNSTWNPLVTGANFSADNGPYVYSVTIDTTNTVVNGNAYEGFVEVELDHFSIYGFGASIYGGDASVFPGGSSTHGSGSSSSIVVTNQPASGSDTNVIKVSWTSYLGLVRQFNLRNAEYINAEPELWGALTSLGMYWTPNQMVPEINRLSNQQEVTTYSGDVYTIASNEAILKYKNGVDIAVIARGDLGLDSIAAVSYAKYYDSPILLVKPNEIPEVTLNALTKLGIKKTIIIGGPEAVSDSVLSQLPNPSRYGGFDRYETAALIALEFITSNNPDTLIITDGLRPDGTTLMLAAEYNAPIIYVEGDIIPTATREIILNNEFKTIVLVGISSKAENEINGLL